jgi:serine/threonine-protein kinase
VRLLADVCSALDGAHRAGLVHRDVKPANVLLTGLGDDEHAYLADFGLTRDAASDSGLTGTGQMVGTIDYAAPEQFAGGRVDARTDVYSAACLAFHALTARVPFPGATAAKLHGHLAGLPPRASELVADLPPAVDEVLARGMAKQPAERYPSAGDLARHLTAVHNGRPNLEPTRTVATGCALTGIPTVADGATRPLAPPAAVAREPRAPRGGRVALDPTPAGAPRPRRRWVPAAAVGGALLLLLAGAGGALLLAGGSGHDARTTVSSTSPASAPAATETVATTVTAAPPRSTATTSAPRADTPTAAPSGESPLDAAERQRRFTTGQDASQAAVAAVCAVTSGQLKCWTPNDGFSLLLPTVGTGTRLRDEEIRNRDRQPAYPPIGFGQRWSAAGFTCVSRPGGLTCSNRDGHGWTLPRYRGLPAYF